MYTHVAFLPDDGKLWAWRLSNVLQPVTAPPRKPGITGILGNGSLPQNMKLILLLPYQHNESSGNVQKRICDVH